MTGAAGPISYPHDKTQVSFFGPSNVSAAGSTVDEIGRKATVVGVAADL